MALARAIVAEAPAGLMDEPLSNLDAKMRVETRQKMGALEQRPGFTMVHVTHDQVEATRMADQVVLMRDGRIEQDDTPAGLYGLAGHYLRGGLHRHAAHVAAAAAPGDALQEGGANLGAVSR